MWGSIWRLHAFLANLVALDGLASMAIREKARQSGRDFHNKSVWKFARHIYLSRQNPNLPISCQAQRQDNRCQELPATSNAALTFSCKQTIMIKQFILQSQNKGTFQRLAIFSRMCLQVTVFRRIKMGGGVWRGLHGDKHGILYFAGASISRGTLLVQLTNHSQTKTCICTYKRQTGNRK